MWGLDKLNIKDLYVDIFFNSVFFCLFSIFIVKKISLVGLVAPLVKLVNNKKKIGGRVKSKKPKCMAWFRSLRQALNFLKLIRILRVLISLITNMLGQHFHRTIRRKQSPNLRLGVET